MAMFVKELRRCLREIDDDKKVGIDGLTLRQIGDPKVYAEVGGMLADPPLECSTHGIPILTREQKLNALLYCVQDDSCCSATFTRTRPATGVRSTRRCDDGRESVRTRRLSRDPLRRFSVERSLRVRLLLA